MPETARGQVAEHRAVAEAVDALLPTLAEITERLCAAFEAGGRLYTFGNGGSAADAQHLAAELIGRYLFYVTVVPLDMPGSFHRSTR